MVISPPFLPPRDPAETDASWFARAMQQQLAQSQEVGAQEGAFPIAAQFTWHTGLHLTAPPVPGGVAPVRAIADGKVIYIRQPTEYTADPVHPQNYSPDLKTARWSDTGCVIVEHSTDIGTTGEVPTTFVYYSLTMHLRAIDPAIKRDGRVYRKDILGQPGKSYGAPADIHFEICCNDEQIRKLTGADPTWAPPFKPVTPTRNGRTDVVFGDLFIYLPASTPTLAEAPKAGDVPLRPRTGSRQTLGKAQWVRIRYEKGDSLISSLDEEGNAIGTGKSAKDFEYEFYKKAVALHKLVAPHVHDGQSCPSAWYELLRFGRNLGPDELPLDAVHWREIPTAAGSLWADLNAVGTFKFSDGDFLPIAEWKFFSDDTDYLDQRCQSVNLRRWIRDPHPDNPIRDSLEELGKRLADEKIRKRLKRAVCKFPTEWDAATIEARNRWALNPQERTPPVDKEQWDLFLRHAKAMCMSDLPRAYLDAQWRFHPQEFVRVMEHIGWLSLDEIAQLIPRNSAIEKSISWQHAIDRLKIGTQVDGGMPRGIHRALNISLRKYGSSQSPVRLAHFLCQCLVETGLLKNSTEKGDEAYFRKMYEVITLDEAGQDYDNLKGIAWRMGFTSHMVNGQKIIYARTDYISLRPLKVQKKAQELGNVNLGDGARFRGRGLIQMTGHDNYASYGSYRGKDYITDPGSRLISADAETAADAALKYWINAGGFNGKNLNILADLGDLMSIVEKVTRAVNGSLTALSERQELFQFIIFLLGDGIIEPSDFSKKKQNIKYEARTN